MAQRGKLQIRKKYANIANKIKKNNFYCADKVGEKSEETLRLANALEKNLY